MEEELGDLDAGLQVLGVEVDHALENTEGLAAAALLLIQDDDLLVMVQDHHNDS